MGDNDYIGLEERGEIRGREEGRLEGLITLICKKLAKNMSEEEIADILEEEMSLVHSICQAAKKYAPEYDVDAIYGAYIKENSQ